MSRIAQDIRRLDTGAFLAGEFARKRIANLLERGRPRLELNLGCSPFFSGDGEVNRIIRRQETAAHDFAGRTHQPAVALLLIVNLQAVPFRRKKIGNELAWLAEHLS